MAVSPLALKLLGTGAIAVPTISLGIVYKNEIYETFTGNVNYLTKIELPSKCNLSSKSCQLTKDDLNKLQFIFSSSNKGAAQITKGDNEIAIISWEEINQEAQLLGNLLFSIKANSSSLVLDSKAPQITIPSTEGGMKFKLIQDKTDSKYYFEQLNQKDKELSAGLNCLNNNTCTLSNASGEITKNTTINKTTTEGETKYSVSFSPTTNKDGDYTLSFNQTNKKWELSKLQDYLTKWDKEVLNSGKWATSNTNNKLTVTVTESNQKINGNDPGKAWTWECEITINNGDKESSNIDLSSQETELKTKLGIDPANTESPDIKNQKKKFVENCARNRGTTQKENAKKEDLTNTSNKVQSTIILDKEIKSEENNKIQLKNEDFLKLFSEQIANFPNAR